MEYVYKFMEYGYKFLISVKMLLLLIIIPAMFLYFMTTKDRMVLGILFDRMGSDFKKLGIINTEK